MRVVSSSAIFVSRYERTTIESFLLLLPDVVQMDTAIRDASKVYFAVFPTCALLLEFDFLTQFIDKSKLS